MAVRLSATAALGWAGAAPAQEAPVTLDPVRVEGAGETATSPVPGYVARQSATATKSDTPLIETPQSVSVIGQRQIEAQAAQRIVDAVRYNAGVQTGAFGYDPRFEQIYLRGFDVIEFGDYKDGLRQANAGFSYFRTEPYGLERIEILRGPSSVLYGQSTPGGLINKVAKRPLTTPLYEIQGQLGSQDRLQGGFDLSGPVDKAGRVLYRLTGLARDAETTTDFVKDNRLFLAPAVTLQPNERTSLTLLAHYQYDESATNPFYYINPAGKVENFLVTDPSFEKLDQEQAQLGYEFRHDINEAFTVRQNLRYGQIHLEGDYLDPLELQADGRTLDRGAFSIEDELGNFAVDNQVESRFGTGPLGHTLLAGADYQRSYYNTRFGIGPAPSLDLQNREYGQDVTAPELDDGSRQHLRGLGLYLHDQIRFGQGWVVSLGGRQDWVTNDTNDKVGGSKSEQDDDAFTWRAGLLYHFDIGLAPYASYSESFVPTLGLDAGGEAFEPIEGRQYEVGLKVQPRGWESSLVVSAFHLTQKNALATDPDNLNFQIQTGEARTRGLEVEGVASLMAGLDLIASYAYLDSEVTEGDEIEEGNELVVRPEHTAAVWMDYTRPKGALTGLGGGAGVRFASANWADRANTERNDNSTLFDAGLHYERGPVRLGLNADNVFDKDETVCNDGYCYASEGRRLYATLRLRW